MVRAPRRGLTGGMSTATHPTVTTPRPLSITSFVLGLGSLVFGWTFVAPIAGLVVGILALGREPHGRAFAIWGIVLSSLMLAGVGIAVLLALLGIGIGFAFLPFAFL